MDLINIEGVGSFSLKMVIKIVERRPWAEETFQHRLMAEIASTLTSPEELSLQRYFLLSDHKIAIRHPDDYR